VSALFRRGLERLALVESKHGELTVISCALCATQWERTKDLGPTATRNARQLAGWHALEHERAGEKSPAFLEAERAAIVAELEQARTNYEDVIRDPESADKRDLAWSRLERAQAAAREAV